MDKYEALLLVLREALLTLKGIKVEMANARRHSVGNEEFILLAIRDLAKVLRQMEIEMMKEPK